MSLNAITDVEYLRLKAEKCGSYREKLIIAGKIASVSRKVVKSADEFDKAKVELSRIKRYINTLPRTIHKRNLLSLVQCAMWRVIGSRLVYHEEKERMHWLISALGRPPVKPVKKSLPVHVRLERKHFKIFGFTL